jgi:hypothetical protein
VNAKGKVHCSLLMSKARVTPLKYVSIPRLELQAAVTATQVNNLIRQQLGLKTTSTFWSDSQAALGYIKNPSKKLKIYVANRVQQIRDQSNPNQWFYVPTSVNPADHASRGLQANQLLTTNWFCGPEFLWQEPMEIPKQSEFQIELDDPEVRCQALRTQANPPPTLARLLERFSNWEKAIKVTEVFMNKLYSIRNKTVDKVTRYKETVTQIIKSAQEWCLEEVEILRKGKKIPECSGLYKLTPFLDQQGVLRVGSRLKNSEFLEYEEKHPAILPRDSHITLLLLRHFHTLVAHQGREITLAKIRAAGYWIINARSAISSMIHQCVTCKRMRAKPSIPQMSALPEDRVSVQPPFTCVGIDCFGPFVVKEKRSEVKRYGLMVTCLASRAVHIETLDDLSTSAFINGIRNVIAIRGPIKEIRCDRGTNFVGAISDISQKGILEFKVNPPSASHMGGVWERMIRTARNVLKGMLRSYGGRLDTSGLRTLLYEVMAIMNSRPLSSVSEEQVPLTPNNLLTMKSDVVLPPPGKFEEADIYAKKRWRAVQHLANAFWQRWKTEFLSGLQARQKWVKDQPNITVGSIVIIKDEDMIRNRWIIGRVVDCNLSGDGCVRSVRVLLGNGETPKKSDKYLVRPVSKVIVLLDGK